MNIFRQDLSEEEIKKFRNWSREHPEYLESYLEKIGVWHPYVIAEYNQMALERERENKKDG